MRSKAALDRHSIRCGWLSKLVNVQVCASANDMNRKSTADHKLSVQTGAHDGF